MASSPLEGFLQKPLSQLHYLVDHVIFPPKLPQCEDAGTEKNVALLDLVLDTARVYGLLQTTDPTKWEIFFSSVSSCHELHRENTITPEAMAASLRSMGIDSRAFRLFHLQAQNAAILIYQRDNDDSVFVEAFEVSPENEQVFSSPGALVRSFPDASAKMSKAAFHDPNFQDHFAGCLAQMSSELVRDFMPSSRKAKTTVEELRDTVIPSLVTDMLMTVVEANGERAVVKKTHKRTHDDVLWDRVREPFRRSPLWLVLRVGLQRTLRELFGDKDGLYHYKNFIALAISRICFTMTTELVQLDVAISASAKLARRLHKGKVNPLLEHYFHSVLQHAKGFARDSWSWTRAGFDHRLSKVASAAHPSDLRLSLTHSGTHLLFLLDNDPNPQSEPEVSLNCNPRIKQIASCVPEVEIIALPAFDRELCLSDFETWVDLLLPQWGRGRQPSSSSCSELAHSMSKYESAARTVYKSDPEQLSVMILTLVDLWCELDRHTVAVIPLLQKFHPEIPVNFLDSLLLAKPRDVQRLAQIEMYLHRRHQPSFRSVFCDPHSASFASTYFDQSIELHDLCERILSKDRQEIHEKQKELARLKAEHQTLVVAAMPLPHCQQQRRNKKTKAMETVHESWHCSKCHLVEKARNLVIAIHESPLPEERDQRKAAIFALETPLAFSIWRNTTWHLVQDLGRMRHIPGGDPCELLLDQYDALQPYHCRDLRVKRVQLASKTKSFVKSHYGNEFLQVSDVDIHRVCLPNALKYCLWDSHLQVWINDQVLTMKAHESFFRSPLPSDSPFSVYRAAVDEVGHTPNVVISKRSTCPLHIRLDEGQAFLEVRSRITLQWEVMLRELALSNIDFSKAQSSVLYNHAALQCGPRSREAMVRNSHRQFEDENFCSQLLAQLSTRFESIAANWRQRWCMKTIITLTLRLIWFSSFRHLVEASKKLLERVRSTLFEWTITLTREMRHLLDEKFISNRKEDLIWAALLCRKTYSIYVWAPDDVQPDQLQDSGYWLSCSLVLNRLVQVPLQEYPLLDRVELLQDRKLCHALEKSIRAAILTSPISLNNAINAEWPGERQYESWEAPCDRWVKSEARESGNETLSKKRTLHYNLLDGTLLIDGRLLRRLPSNFTADPEYVRLFGKHSFEVYPSILAGMTYSASATFEEHEIHFGTRSNNLCIRAKKKDSVFELVPASHFSLGGADPDLPNLLIDDCVHWLNLGTGIMDIRRLASCWQEDPNCWRIHIHDAKAFRGSSQLVDLRSNLQLSIADSFTDLEAKPNIVVYQGLDRDTKPAEKKLFVELPRYDLLFTVTSHGNLNSSKLRAHVEDKQSIGTLIGLRSKLVMRRHDGQFVLVPRGTIIPQKSSMHTEIRIVNSGVSAEYSKFDVDAVLGRIARPSEPQDLYYLALLHAITSSGLTDPLTNRSGTEEALSVLKSAVAQPWHPLDQTSCEFLSQIAALTPSRSFYPTHLRTMQQVTWNKQFSTSTQHDEFHFAVEAIRAHSDRLLSFHPAPSSVGILARRASDTQLLKRARQKNARYWNADLLLSSLSAPQDSPYKSRVHTSGIERGQRVFEAASMAKNWSSNLDVSHSVVAAFDELKSVGGFHDSFTLGMLSDLLHLDLSNHWGALFHSFSRMSRDADRFRLMFMVSTIAFGADFRPHMSKLRSLLSVAFEPSLKTSAPPKWSHFREFRLRHILKDWEIYDTIEPTLQKFVRNQKILWHNSTDDELTAEDEREAAHKRNLDEAMQRFASDLKEQWPAESINKHAIRTSRFLNLNNAVERLQPSWLQRIQNHQLFGFATELQAKLKLCKSHSVPLLAPHPFSDEGVAISCSLVSQPTLEASLSHVTTVLQHEFQHSSVSASTPRQNTTSDRIPRPEEHELERVLATLSQSSKPVNKQYAANLAKSLNAWKTSQCQTFEAPCVPTAQQLNNAANEAQRVLEFQLSELKTLGEESDLFRWLQYGQLWPRYTLSTLLGRLNQTGVALQISPAGSAILEMGLSVSKAQHFCRLKGFQTSKKEFQFNEELRNAGHENWDPADIPQWLLLEIESNLLIREEQVQVARQMIDPRSGTNSVMQLNMGKGKSSVILPMVALVLADGKMLLRIVVPKPLLTQTSQVLRLRLGDLLNRGLYHVPYSRATATDVSTTQAFRNLQESCLASGGILLSLPEHVLSFKLYGLERMSGGATREALPMLETQHWLDRVSRDILDECDEILHPRQQLIYPSGKQSLVDGSPGRWKTAQAVLQLTEKCLPDLMKEHPQGINAILRDNGAFPQVFIIRREAEDRLVEMLAKRICSHESDVLPVHRLTQQQLEIIRAFITRRDRADECVQHIDLLSESIRKTVLLLRGFLGLRILPLALEKRWNVEFGLHLSRCQVAVPYRGKGIPSAGAEFGHPDVAILLTSLAYYFSGISLSQFRNSIKAVLCLDDPGLEYDKWMQCHGSMPQHLQDHRAVNLEDEQQIKGLHVHLQYTVATIDHFCNTMVFPDEAREFEKKLVSSAWDLVLMGANCRVYNSSNTSDVLESASEAMQEPLRGSLSTGFSGTNDFSDLLPNSICQRDLENLLHTNAEVLVHMLQPRNRAYVCASGPQGQKLDTQGLIDLISSQNPPIRILLDAGAQILDMDNLGLVRYWLSVNQHAPAAIYFSKTDKAMVLHRDGRQEALSASSYSADSGDCLAYLDEHHCRGTDLKFPADARAALSVGPHQTKDHTAQAAMRMRQLAHSQSVLWLAPPEVHQSILDLTGETADVKISSFDVIQWILEQTCRKIEIYQPLFISQGVGYCSRQKAMDHYNSKSDDEAAKISLLSAIEQPESRTLEELYMPKGSMEVATIRALTTSTSIYDTYELELQQMRSSLGSDRFHSESNAHEEQERELDVEAEEERQVQRPQPANPLTHNLHKDVVRFVSTEMTPLQPTGLKPIFAATRQTSLQNDLNDPKIGGTMHASVDFLYTVDTRTMDDFQRPVNWLLWSHISSHCLIISPFEAELLLPALQAQKKVHLIHYSAPVSKKTLHFNGLAFRSVPALHPDWKPPTWLVRALGLFAGRTFFSWDEAAAVCAYMDLKPPSQSNSAVRTVIPFMKKPLPFVQKWIMIRRGADFSYSPMGFLCAERALPRDHAFFRE